MTLRDFRKRNGLTGKEASDEVGVSPHTYYEWESGRVKKPSLENMKKIRKFVDKYGVTETVTLCRGGRIVKIVKSIERK